MSGSEVWSRGPKDRQPFKLARVINVGLLLYDSPLCGILSVF